MATNNRVGPGELHAAANQLEDLMHQAIDTLNRYYQHSQDLLGQGGLTGAAGSTNIVTAEDIQQAAMKLQNRWGNVISTLRSSTQGYSETDSHNAQHIASVGSELSWT
jgi:uncharacterized protein YukE